jgi:hypothetical protein
MDGELSGGRMECGHALDEPLWKPQASAKQTLAAGHLAAVGLVVVARHVKQTVEHEHLGLGGKRVALFDGLTERGGNADGQVTRYLFGADAPGGEGKHVSGLVFTAKLAIEAANGRVGGEQNVDLPLEPHSSLRQLEKARQSARRGQAMGARDGGRGGRRQSFG